ncbi:alpha-keto acid decarboxylase family protein [Streptomyces kaniharaensis]|uniref:Alpha-keto-acid decarboxylase n=1 Tax=Streptomyces kaniharaensis TaxID=212423 RepID=A0A6N7KVQ8_9ACTN|nr:thiamine pyrophosphate-binding protein [Streptomyces kaniharaensis]MQS15716.1 alpha-keto acid decarboxylase family protein [Streptomyces kaniharaensis]
MSGNDEWTVARYLATRLEQLGIRYLFGVPGDFLGPFLTIMQATTGVRWIGTPTEMGGGYAADAYARVRAADADPDKREQGVGAVAVTYGVGAFSLLNTIGGAYVEDVPLIAINAAPSYEQWLNQQAVGLLTSHMSPRRESNLDVYRQVTVDAQVLSNPGLAPSQIDSAITACLTERKPVYLEVMEDLWHAPCEAPKGELHAHERPFTKRNEEMLAKAVTAAVELIGKFGTPIVWAGEELVRQRLENELLEFVQTTRMQFCTTVGAKSVVSERHPLFAGVYNGKASLPEIRKTFKNAGCRIGLGTWSTSKNLGGDQSIGDDWIVAARDGVSVGANYFPEVQLGRFIAALRNALAGQTFPTDHFALAHAAGLDVPASTADFLDSLSTDQYPPELTYDSFFQHINFFLEHQATGGDPEAPSPFTVVSDAAFALLGSMNLRITERAGFLAQNSWLSIGYSVGAATGVALGRQQPMKRPLVFVGDGSFQEICQELSTQVRHHLRPVVFVLDNEGFYGIEQMLVSPCYYKEKPSNGADFYNVLHPWRYEKLAEVFGTDKDRMHGYELTTHTELRSLLLDIADPGNDLNHAPILARVRLSRHDYPKALQYKIDEKCT